MVQTNSYQDQAFSQIETMILRLELKPGERINKNDLVNSLGIGVTPLREALIRLQREGLLKILPQSGTFVSKINLSQVYQARFVRRTLEQEVVGEACEVITESQLNELKKIVDLQEVYLKSRDYDNFFDLDDQFHRIFYEIAKKLFVWDWLKKVNVQFNRFRYLRLDVSPLDWGQIYSDHTRLIQAVSEGNVKKARDLVSSHLGMVDTDAEVVKAKFPSYFE